MAKLAIDSKGRITIPIEVRGQLGIKGGDRIEFVQIEPGRFELIAVNQSVKNLKGMFGRPRKKVTIADTQKAIAAR